MRSPPPHYATLNGSEYEAKPRDSHADHINASLLRRLPPHVAKDVIAVPPSQSFRDVQAERERRLRLLLRRYVNQIQYGCLNRNCSTPTCLSYRKRNSKGPVRAYSESSARSLACHLIEEHSRPGKDPNDGLCQNQPVIPWYRDPISNQRVYHHARDADHRTRISENTTPPDLPQPCLHKQSPTPQQHEGSGKAARLQERNQPQEEDPPTDAKLDPASFTQSIWNTYTPRSLLQHATPPSASPRIPPEDTCSTACCGLTLRRLTWTSLQWLRTDIGETVSGSPFEKFIRNSLFYSLTNPRRLDDSAESWKSTPEFDATEILDRVTNAPDKDEPVLDEFRMGNSYKTKITDASSSRVLTRRSNLDIPATLLAFETIAASGLGLDGLFSMLRAAVQGCYGSSHRRPSIARLKASASSAGLDDPTERKRAAESLALILLAMMHPFAAKSLTDRGLDIIKFGHIARARSENSSYPSVAFHSGLLPSQNEVNAPYRVSIDVADILENSQLRYLSASLMDCISHHLALDAMSTQLQLGSKSHTPDVIELVLTRLCNGLPEVHFNKHIYARIHIGLCIQEIARNVIAKEWDREPIVRRTSPVGAALQFLKRLYHQRSFFRLTVECFHSSFIADTLADPETLCQWLTFDSSGSHMHILSFAFLLDTATLVRYFRSINIAAMKRVFESAVACGVDVKRFLLSTEVHVDGSGEALAAMRTRMARFFVLTIRRGSLLEDALDQLWRRERREVLRPLRVLLGKGEGEDGIDHGGVQQEFFRLAFAEAFAPEKGMFTTDSRTHMTWLQPGSYEPLYKFEALGILMSLAVYNAITLPITMPLAFYRKLLGLKVKKLEHITDGWPDLANGLRSLLEFEGDVGEVIGRTYEFSYEFAGTTVNIDMQKAPEVAALPLRVNKRSKEKSKSASFELTAQLDITPPSQSPPTEPNRNLSRISSLKGISTPLSLESDTAEEAALVTNTNRERYVKDYIRWLTDKSIRQQWDAFAKGFFTCIDRTALSLFSPEQLQHVIEGHREISIDELEATATYEDYDRDSPYIRDFWLAVRSFTSEQHRQLLEFVTASDRVPVNGMRSVNFMIQKNGTDVDDRLPSSQTCYQRLLLPQYSSGRVLRMKLEKALENSKGFGVA